MTFQVFAATNDFSKFVKITMLDEKNYFQFQAQWRRNRGGKEGQVSPTRKILGGIKYVLSLCSEQLHQWKDLITVKTC